ncbi:MAG TPA: NAD-dependent epimerase/dehydratase family protein [Ktedonobacteraceae bacterium]|nr:NAD-dependent epimerase/dehydratase family protein [Ktedonobacteraceae bacterium]
MRVFVLGATGWIGSAITDSLLASRHQVMGLARRPDAIATLEAKGVAVVQGNLSNPEVVSQVAQQADAVIIASSAPLGVTVVALKVLIAALQETQKPLIYISGSSLYGDIGNQEQVHERVFVHRLATEPAMHQSPEQIVYQAKEQGIHGMIVIGAGILYGRAGGATPTFWLSDAMQRGVAWFIGGGAQRWSAVHVDDLARLTVLALEQRPARRVFNAVAESLALREAAELIAQATNVPGGVRGITEEAARKVWAPFWATILAGNLWLSSTQAEHDLGWKLLAPSFKEDLLYGSYRGGAH